VHVAASNVNVTEEFIDVLRDTDPRLQNAELDTPFHVAAKSSNPNVIVYLLTTFRPTNAGWDIDSVDENRGDTAPTLVNMCAASGNARAVALLIQHGADVSQGVLHEVVIASVKKPELTDHFLAVYKAVVDNVVTWRCLQNNSKCLISGSADYNDMLRETMIYLTTKPFIDGKNVIQRAIELGAAEMLTAILNTNNVYKFNEFGFRKYDRLRVMCSYSRYDVTDFARTSMRPLDGKIKSEEDPTDHAEGSQDTVILDFRKHHQPRTSYLEELLVHCDEWTDKNILATQPLRKMTKPYFDFVQRYYFFLGLVQLIFMILFSVHYIPNTYTLAGMFGSTSPHFNVSTLDASTVEPRESPSWLWLTWPVIVFVGSTTDFVIRFVWNTAIHVADYAHNRFTPDHQGLKVLKRLSMTIWPTKLLLAVSSSFPLISFSVSVFFWFYRHAHRDDRQQYLEALSMVLLFGWMVNFVLFSGITQHLYVFLLVLNEIIVQDIILSFILVFVYTVVAFSFSLYALRLKDATIKDALLRTTVYDVFVSALGNHSFSHRFTYIKQQGP